MGRRSVAIVCAMGFFATACVPYFGPEGSVTAENSPSGAVLSWTAAIDESPTEELDYYEIEADGSVIATIDAPTRLCLLSGGSPGVIYELSVTAYFDSGDWSGTITAPIEDWGRLVTLYTPTAGTGGPLVCTVGADDDGDGLPNVVETNTGTFVDLTDTGTDPNDADTDDDQLDDGAEVFGTEDGLDLPGLGVSPLHKDLLLEYDWFDDSNDCGAHSHRPSAAVMAALESAFAAAPVPNPDGVDGINLINDYGQGGIFDGGNMIPDADGVIAGNVFGPDFQNYKATNLAANRQGFFHYVLLPHRYNLTSGSSGYAEIYGDDLIVSLQCVTHQGVTQNTIMHEVGHNLNLRHGGDQNANFKPNYNSVMNYRYQFPGADGDCDALGDGVLDFSHGINIALNEANLDENAGVCGTTAIDWNGNGTFQSSIAFDLNGGGLTTLEDVDDWAFVTLDGITGGSGAGQRIAPVGVEEPPVPEEYLD